MSSSRLVRGVKTRVVASVCVFLLLGALVYVFHGTQARIADVQKMANACSQKTESLSAQLQVLIEYKSKVEKSLQSEKKEHKKYVDENERKLKEQKEGWQKEKEELLEKMSLKMQEYTALKSKFDDTKEKDERRITDLESESNKLRESYEKAQNETSRLISERDTLKRRVSELEEKLERAERDLADAKTLSLPKEDRIAELEHARDTLRDQLDQAKKDLKKCSEAEGTKVSGRSSTVGQQSGVVGQPDKLDNGMVVRGGSSTTPGINPQALYTAESSARAPTKDSRQENRGLAEPLVAPEGGAGPAAGVGQIPLPPEENIGPKSRSNNQEEGLRSQVEAGALRWGDTAKQEMNNAAIEDTDTLSLHEEGKPGGRSRDAYPDRDYKEDQADEDEDDEGERTGGEEGGVGAAYPHQSDHLQPHFNME